MSWLLLLLAAPWARGAVLYERSIVVDRSVNIFATSQFDLEFVFGDAYFAPTNPVKLFEDVALSPASVGQVFESTPASDPAFASVVGRLTDGHDEYVRLVLEESSSGRREQRGWRESGFFVGLGSTHSPDLAGSVVEAVQLRIDGFRLTRPPAASSAGPPVQLTMTFTLLGVAVPEPATWTLAAVGLAWLARSVYTGRR